MPAVVIVFSVELSGHEGKEVGAQGLSPGECYQFARGGVFLCRITGVYQFLSFYIRVGHGFPVCRHLQRQGIQGLHVRLVETGEEGAGPVRNKQRVQKFVVAVEGLVIGREGYLHGILSASCQGCRDYDMFIGHYAARLCTGIFLHRQEFCPDCLSIDLDRMYASSRLSEIKYDIFRALQGQAGRNPAFDPLGARLRYVEMQAVSHISVSCFTPLCQFFWHARLRNVRCEAAHVCRV